MVRYSPTKLSYNRNTKDVPIKDIKWKSFHPVIRLMPRTRIPEEGVDLVFPGLCPLLPPLPPSKISNAMHSIALQWEVPKPTTPN